LPTYPGWAMIRQIYAKFLSCLRCSRD